MNGTFNPLTAPLTMIKQVGEQASAAIQSVGTGMAQTASQGLDTLISGVPGLPGLPGAGQPAGLPSVAGLLPANLQQALNKVENLLIPPGLPKPSQAMKADQNAIPTENTPTPYTTDQTVDETPPAVATRRRVAERRGY